MILLIDFFSDVWRSSKRFRIGLTMIAMGVIVSLIAGVPLGAIVVLFVVAGGFAVGGAMFESIVNRKPRSNDRAPVVFKTQPFFFVAVGKYYINLAHVTFVHRREKDCMISQSDGEPIFLSADEEKQFFALVDDYAVTSIEG
jgi:hypothetical protein